ncbi:SUMF1/EgtB/PvdO family nonheme iron enzyme [Thiothrix lacustris]|uniref:SUMF1/EgtB/PvdO family nonheme iron enzyme n=1 Tax=Thiothrix lacustris TaxID=525917 RepID=UPI000686E9A1|nr:SUMF1/EgtB/PvdO family nonheme iron enzyme [Thiothrix lacustris]
MVTDKLNGVCLTGITGKAEIPQNIGYYPFIWASLSVIKMHDIFLSYSTKDRARLQPLFQALAQQGWSVFWDHQSIHTGDNWHRKIDQAIRESRCVVVVWSKSSIDSEWVLEEASRGKSRNVLLPIRIDAIEPPFGFGMRQAGDFTGWNGKGDHPAFIELAAQVYGLLGRGSSPPLLPPVKSHAGLWVTGLVAMSVVGGYVYNKSSKQVEPQPESPAVVQSVMPKPVPVVPAEPSPTPVSDALVATKQPLEPVMVDIPAGTFTMGCDGKRDDVEGGCSDDEKPAHEVTLDAFKMAKTEVTFDQWDACEKAKACPHAEDQGWGRGNRPVINVSWDDITQKYIPWLSQETGKHYRLPTEAEWEYAARGGADTAYPWGNAIGKGNANCYKDFCGDKFEYTAPVGSFAANGYGLNDMNGNVWEWVQDSWHSDYKDAPADGSAWESGGSASRVLRGGSWYNFAQYVRSADRGHYTPVNRSRNLGFRLASGQ